jgi:hypothetical protein
LAQPSSSFLVKPNRNQTKVRITDIFAEHLTLTFFLDNDAKVREALKGPRFSAVRRQINESSVRAHNLLAKVGINNIVQEYPAPAIGGSIRTFKLFDLITTNGTSKRMDKHEFLDPIDQAIGALSTMSREPAQTKQAGNATYSVSNLIFVAMPMDPTDAGLEDVHNSIKDVAKDFQLEARRVDDFQTNERITDTLLGAIRTARLVVVDLTLIEP